MVSCEGKCKWNRWLQHPKEEPFSNIFLMRIVILSHLAIPMKHQVFLDKAQGIAVSEGQHLWWSGEHCGLKNTKNKSEVRCF